MANAKPAAKRNDGTQTSEPRASRPRLPKEYGVPRSAKNLLPWSHVTERMARARHYWISTVDQHGQPHATPVDGLWIDGRLYFGGSPQTRRQRNLAANPKVCVHLESATDVVMLQGEAHAHRPDHALAVRLADESNRKYGYGQKPGEYEQRDVHMFRPSVVFAWANTMSDATRWNIENEN